MLRSASLWARSVGSISPITITARVRGETSKEPTGSVADLRGRSSYEVDLTRIEPGDWVHASMTPHNNGTVFFDSGKRVSGGQTLAEASQKARAVPKTICRDIRPQPDTNEVKTSLEKD